MLRDTRLTSLLEGRFEGGGPPTTLAFSKPAAFGWLFAVLAWVAVLVIGGTAAASGHIFDVEVSDRMGYEHEFITNATVNPTGLQGEVEYIGDQNTTYGAAGTGTFNSFVRLQGNGTEDGYNTDGTPEFDTKSGTWTHSLRLSELPTITIGGASYFEVWADINESDSNKLISLDDFELWLTDDPSLVGYPFAPTDAEIIYDWSGHILINDVNQGSGRGDLRMFIPYDPSILGDDCAYGSSACTTYVVLYSSWGAAEGDYETEGGFEEWKVREYPVVTITKTINGSYDRERTWNIVKTDDAEYDLWIGGDQDHPYVLDVDSTDGDPSNPVISGEITIVGDDKEDVTVEVSDVFEGLDANGRLRRRSNRDRCSGERNGGMHLFARPGFTNGRDQRCHRNNRLRGHRADLLRHG